MAVVRPTISEKAQALVTKTSVVLSRVDSARNLYGHSILLVERASHFVQ